MSNVLLSFASLMARALPVSLKRSLYRSPWLSGVIRRALNRVAPSGLSDVYVAAGGLRGARLLLDLQSEKDYWLGTYEIALQNAVSDFAKPGMVAYDVGANIGYVTLLFARLVGSSGKVFAFEAFPANLERLRANLKLNAVESQVVVVPGAVADKRGMVRFLVGPSNGMGKVVGSAGRESIEEAGFLNVQSISLDAFVFEDRNPPPDLVKIDIEGGEVLALPGMHRLLAEVRPVILLELHGPEAAQIVWNELVEAGYRLSRMASGYQELHSVQELAWKEYLVAIPPV